MKKITAIILAALFCITAFVLASCDGGNASDISDTSDVSSDITSSDSQTSQTSSESVEESNDDNSSAVSDESQTSDVSQPEELKSNCKLIINGKDISEEHYVEMHKDSKMVYVPFTAVIEALGGKVEWKSETKAVIRIFDLYRIFEYTLNTEKGTLVDEWGHNKFEYEEIGRLPEGYKLKSKTVNGEYLVDDTVCEAFFSYIPAYTLVDYTDGIVRIGTDDYEKSAKLIINGRDVTGENTVYINYTRKFAALPFFHVIKELGGTIVWENEEVAVVTLGETTKTIDLSREVEDSFTLLMGGYGGVIELEGEEIIIDEHQLWYDFLRHFGADVDIDFDKRVVTIYMVE